MCGDRKSILEEGDWRTRGLVRIGIGRQCADDERLYDSGSGECSLCYMVNVDMNANCDVDVNDAYTIQFRR